MMVLVLWLEGIYWSTLMLLPSLKQVSGIHGAIRTNSCISELVVGLALEIAESSSKAHPRAMKRPPVFGKMIEIQCGNFNLS